MSAIDSLQQRLAEKGFSPEQICEINSCGIERTIIDEIAKLSPEDCKLAFNTIKALVEQLPGSVILKIFPQDDAIPTIAAYVRDLPHDDRERAGVLFKSRAGNDPKEYQFDMGRGWIQLRSIYAEGTS